MKASGFERKTRAASWLPVLVVFAAVFACYWPALNGALLWDDPAHITSEELQSWSGLGRIWFELGATQQYYPVLHTTFWIEHRLWGESVLGYHLINTILHATSCCLLALILRRLGTSDAAIQTAGSNWAVLPGFEWLGAILFAVHPVCVESVAWISEQKNTLSLFFYLLAALEFLDYWKRRRLRSYALASILFLLALGTKSVTATLPAALLVILWWRNGRLSWRSDVIPLLPWFAAALGAGLLTAWVERTYIGAQGTSFDLTLVQRVLLASHVVWFYLGKLVWPFDLAFFYPRWNVAANAPGWIGYFLAGVAVTAILFWFRRRSRAPLAAWLLFVGALFPALGFFNVYPFLFSYVADHFQYLACMVFSAAVAGGLSWIAGRRIPWARAGAGTLGVLLTLGLLTLSRGQSRLYQSVEALSRANIARVPESWMAHHNLGLALVRTTDRKAEAVAEFRKAIALNPHYPESHYALGRELMKQAASRVEADAEFERAIEIRPRYADAHFALGVSLASQPGRLADAIRQFNEALKLRPNMVDAHLQLANALAREPSHLPEAMAHFAEALHLRPDYARAHNDYGAVLAKLPGHAKDAIGQFELALKEDPDFAEAHYNLANILSGIPDRASEAVSHYERALSLDPNAAQVHYSLANLLAFQPGRAAEAISHYEAAIKLKPDFAEAHANLANVLAHIPGRMGDAIVQYEEALKIDPDLAWVHFNLASHLAQMPGRSGEAFSHFDEALRLKPDYTDALNGLAILYAQQGRFDEARAEWQKALKIDPNYKTAIQNLRLLDQMAAQQH